MVIPATGPVSFRALQTEFEADADESNGIQMSTFRGTVQAPLTGALNVGFFRGKFAYSAGSILPYKFAIPNTVAFNRRTPPTLTELRTAYAGSYWTDDDYYFTVSPSGSGIQRWRVPSTGWYQLTASAASGGGGTSNARRVSANVSLVKDSYLYFVLGHRPPNPVYSGGHGGGGGTFVFVDSVSFSSLLMAAGGGGGQGGAGGGTGVASSGMNGNNAFGYVDGGPGAGGTAGSGGTAGAGDAENPGNAGTSGDNEGRGGTGGSEVDDSFNRGGGGGGGGGLAGIDAGDANLLTLFLGGLKGQGDVYNSGIGSDGGFGGGGGGGGQSYSNAQIGPGGGGGGGYSGGGGGLPEKSTSTSTRGRGGGGGSYPPLSGTYPTPPRPMNTITSILVPGAESGNGSLAVSFNGK